jgi:flagellar basal-body rod protein FlgF
MCLKDHDGRPITQGQMERGLYIAASGMLAEQVRQDQIANDLANASTPGYKPDRTTQRAFGALLLRNSASGQPVGELGMGVQADRTVTDWAPGPLQDTGQSLDLAIAGDGFFAVRTAQGVRYTRNGQFGTDARGILVTASGDPVLSQAGQTIRVARGKVDPGDVGVFALGDPRKVGTSLVEGAPAGRGEGEVRTGALEGSGADPARAMVDMIASFRAYEAGQRAITTIDQTLGKAANQVGSTSGS